jgi:hypothetical protein
MVDNPYEEFLSHLTRTGISIHPANADRALSRDDALAALSLLEDTTVWVLGGDVLERTGDRLRYLGEGWHFDSRPTDDEPNESVTAAIDYITSYPMKDAFFTIVTPRWGKRDPR